MGKGANAGQCVHFVCLAIIGERGKPWATCSFCMFGNECGEGANPGQRDNCVCLAMSVERGQTLGTG